MPPSSERIQAMTNHQTSPHFHLHLGIIIDTVIAKTKHSRILREPRFVNPLTTNVPTA